MKPWTGILAVNLTWNDRAKVVVAAILAAVEPWRPARRQKPHIRRLLLVLSSGVMVPDAFVWAAGCRPLRQARRPPLHFWPALKGTLLIVLLAGASVNARAAGALTNEVYVWQRSWTEPVRESVIQHATHFTELVVLAAEVTWRDKKPAVTHVGVDFPTLANAQVPVGLALRIGPFAGPFAEKDTTTTYLTELAAALVAAARANQVEPRELQIDFDCAASKLDGYLVWVEAIRRKVSPVPVTITALPSWLYTPTFPSLALSASNYVLQVHSLARPANLRAPFTLCDPQAAQLAVTQAAHVGVPFRVALPTYGYVLAFDRAGKILDLSAEGPRKNWPDDAQLREVRSDPVELSALVREWGTNRPALMKGVIWYRLPVPVDNLNWRWPTLDAMIAARVPREGLRADARRVEPGLVEISLVNNGDLDISSRLALEVRWSGARLIAGDGLRGFELVEPDDSTARFITKPEFNRLPAAKPRRSAGCGSIRTVRCKLKSKRIEASGLWLTLGLTANSLFACGPDFPNNLLHNGGDAVLAAPQSDFYRELDRLHLAPPGFQAVSSTNNCAEQNITIEQGDLIVALLQAGTKTSETRQIAAAHLAERMKLQSFSAALKCWSNSAPESWDANAQEYVTGQPSGPPPPFPAIKIAAGLPAEFADYFEGALAWFDPHVADKSTCRPAWERLLELPPARRHFKSVATVFMLGKSWAQADPEKAVGYFRQVRALAKSGFADSAGLAAASLGEEARLELRRRQFTPAIDLYLEQLATGDLTAANSLRFAAARALSTDDPATLHQLATDPGARRLITACLISRGTSSRLPSDTSRKLWLAAVEAANVREAESAEEFALAAYQAGEWDQAQRWIDRAPGSPTAQWLQVKLRLRAGKIDDAASLLASLCHSFPVASPVASRQHDAAVQSEIQQRQNNLPLDPPVTNAPASLTDNLTVPGYCYWARDIAVPSQMLGELGVLHLARREYTESLNALFRAGFWMDAAYVAERVLTVDELKTYVDNNWPSTTRTIRDSNASDDESTAEYDSINPHQKIRYLLARRLTRLERGPEATVYYPVKWQSAQTDLLQQLAVGRNESLPARERFYALVSAAHITRTNGMELIGTEVAPDWHIYDGGFDFGLTTDERKTGLLPASEEELLRAAQNDVVPEQRFHYRHQAAALKREAAKQGWEAAKLLPDNSDEAARMLCRSGSWLDAQPAAAYYHAILQRCRQTEIGEETARIGSFPKLDENGRVIRRNLNAEDSPKPGKAYVVHAGDTLFHIAAVVSASGQPLSVADLLMANPKLRTDKIRAGQMLDIPNSSQSEPVQPIEESDRLPAEVEQSPALAGQTITAETYVIERGDSLAKIADAVSRYGWQLSVQDILDANPGLVANRLRVGQVIVIPTPKN